MFSDFLRYQNMLCRYDTAALKCQDIFSVHGFPVGLIQCENNLLGIPGVGGGAYRHFIEKYSRAKEYCAAPFEVRRNGRRNVRVPIPGETIAADLDGGRLGGKLALLYCGPSQTARLAPASLDGVFTDPPYFDNVQYAELIDFCYVWLRRVLRSRASRVSSRDDPHSWRTHWQRDGGTRIGTLHRRGSPPSSPPLPPRSNRARPSSSPSITMTHTRTSLSSLPSSMRV